METKQKARTDWLCGWCDTGNHRLCRSPYTKPSGETYSCRCADHDHVAAEYVPPTLRKGR